MLIHLCISVTYARTWYMFFFSLTKRAVFRFVITNMLFVCMLFVCLTLFFFSCRTFALFFPLVKWAEALKGCVVFVWLFKYLQSFSKIDDSPF